MWRDSNKRHTRFAVGVTPAGPRRQISEMRRSEAPVGALRQETLRASGPLPQSKDDYPEVAKGGLLKLF
jgi:hypothetical protein